MAKIMGSDKTPGLNSGQPRGFLSWAEATKKTIDVEELKHTTKKVRKQKVELKRMGLWDENLQEVLLRKYKVQ